MVHLHETTMRDRLDANGRRLDKVLQNRQHYARTSCSASGLHQLVHLGQHGEQTRQASKRDKRTNLCMSCYKPDQPDQQKGVQKAFLKSRVVKANAKRFFGFAGFPLDADPKAVLTQVQTFIQDHLNDFAWK